MTALFILTALLFFALRGYVEGEVMTMPGVRSSHNFRWYHQFCIVRDLCAVCTGVLFVPLLVPGVLILGWEFSEIQYAIGRYQRGSVSYENVMGLDWYLTGQAVVALHIGRTIAGCALIAAGCFL